MLSGSNRLVVTPLILFYQRFEQDKYVFETNRIHFVNRVELYVFDVDSLSSDIYAKNQFQTHIATV